MKYHTRWITVYVGVVVLLAVFTGIGLERGDTSEHADMNYETNWEPIFASGTVYETGERIEEFDNLMRMDLGYPRIEQILDSYEDVIRRYADRYGFDWRLILALMNQESRFRIQAVSHRGAFGLMQIMPTTGTEVSSELGIDGVALPEDNIAGGVYYLWRMHTMFNPGNEYTQQNNDYEFDRLQLALAAYNGGPTRIRNAQHLARYLQLDPYRWNTIRDLLPMLSSRYSSLHAYVWDEGRPPGGYFEGYQETRNYVDRTVEYYAYYRQMFE